MTWSDLQGARVSISAVHEDRFLRAGKLIVGLAHMSGRIRVGPGKAIITRFQASGLTKVMAARAPAAGRGLIH